MLAAVFKKLLRFVFLSDMLYCVSLHVLYEHTMRKVGMGKCQTEAVHANKIGLLPTGGKM